MWYHQLVTASILFLRLIRCDPILNKCCGENQVLQFVPETSERKCSNFISSGGEGLNDPGSWLISFANVTSSIPLEANGTFETRLGVFPDCGPSGTHQLLSPGVFPSDAFLVTPSSGVLNLIGSKAFFNASDFCLDGLVLTDTASSILPAAVVCQLPLSVNIPKCCPQGEAYQIEANGSSSQCVPTNQTAAFVPPLTNSATVVMEPGRIPECHSRVMLQPHVTPDEMYQITPEGFLHIPKLDFLLESSHFCVDQTVDDPKHPIALMCYPEEPVMEALGDFPPEECLNTTCFQTCCPIGQLYDVSVTGCVDQQSLDEVISPFVPPLQNLADPLPTSYDAFSGDHQTFYGMNPVSRMPFCPHSPGEFIDVYPAQSSNDSHGPRTGQVYLLDTGQLYVADSRITMDIPSYCVGNLKGGDGAIQPFALFCFPTDSAPADPAWLHVTVMTLLTISAVSLFVTIIVSLLLPDSKSLRGLIQIATFASLFFVVLCFIVLRSKPEPAALGCNILGYVSLFAMLSAFFWLNVMSFDTWWKIRSMSQTRSSKRSIQRKFLQYCFYAYGCSLFITLVAVALQFSPGIPETMLRPDFDRTPGCWFQIHRAPVWAYLYGPIAILLVANCIFFLLTARILFLHQRDTRKLDKNKGDTSMLLVCLKLFVIMGISWIAEILGAKFSPYGQGWYFIDFINCLQGFFIFLVFVVKKKSWADLKKRCNFRGPNSMNTTTTSSLGATGSSWTARNKRGAYTVTKAPAENRKLESTVIQMTPEAPQERISPLESNPELNRSF
ncbi:unnamed protein product [Cyprideis torosa]|uniref:Uncharacterized protein n=1 Tax=Cyprideis torosa TaxID=163714 RepID=A0A7R8W799_9CRUS|nr:unnamed protein product [Cyprideis torosa]CAG0882991.1 unnamed protein product [Cyprideis torosa]